MTPAELQALRALAEKATAWHSERKMHDALDRETVLGLLDEVERLRVTDMQAAADFDQALAHETDALRQQLAAMTAARDELADLAEFWLGVRDHRKYDTDKDAARIDALRKVGGAP
jgi:hypothetical protein